MDVHHSKLFEQLNIEEKYQDFSTVSSFDLLGGEKVIEKSIPLFPRLDTNVEIEFIKNFDNPDSKNLLFTGATGLR